MKFSAASLHIIVILIVLYYYMNYLQRAEKFRAKKRLGQNFLIDENVFQTILEAAELSPHDICVEIGAGFGFLTEKLIHQAGQVFAVEIDEDMINELQKIKADNLKILHQDILKTDISALGSGLKIAANIPYYITSPILAHLLGEIDDLSNKNRAAVSEIVLMVQYEAAKRMTADEKSPAKEYGLLSILAQFWADVEFIAKVSSKSFFPAPKVNSAIVRLKVRKEPLLKLSDYSFFKRTARACFAVRRKNIKNSLINAGFNREAVYKTLSKLGINENIRGETLSITDIGVLSEVLKAELC